MAVMPDVESDRKGPTLRKLYYTIGEVSESTGIPAHVLRYWESEFPQLKPKKGRTGNRAYQDKDLRLIQQIRTLLYERKFTIAGARAQLAGDTPEEEVPASNGKVELIEEIRRDLQDILDTLENRSGRGAAR